MRAVILAFICGFALAAMSAQAAPVPAKASPVEPSVAPPVELVVQGADGDGIASGGGITGATGTGGAASRTGDDLAQ
jgi:hypothetical protein